MGCSDCVTLEDADWPDHMVEGRDAALRLAMAGRMFGQWDANALVSILPVLRRPDEEWSDDELKRVDRLVERLGLDEMALFACGTLIINRRAIKADSRPRVKPIEPLAVHLPDGELSYTLHALPHPTLGLPEISDRDEDGYWSFSAGGTVLCKERVSLAMGVRRWNELVMMAQCSASPRLTRGMLENE